MLKKINQISALVTAIAAVIVIVGVVVVPQWADSQPIEAAFTVGAIALTLFIITSVMMKKKRDE